MTSAVSVASKRCSLLLSSVASFILFWPAEIWSQTVEPAYQLEPVVVNPPAKRPARRAARGAPPSAAQSRLQSNAARVGAPPAASAVAPPTAVFAAPTLNLTGTTSTGSRLGLTRLQTPASIDVISAETMAERGQQNITDAVTQNAAGFTASPAPGNGSLSFNTRGFTGNGTVMTLYDGTRLYVGSGTLSFPHDTWSSQRIEVLRGPASVLYGEGAIGGAINVISKMPLWVQSNQAETSFDSNMTRRFAVDSGGPVNKDVAYRITATAHKSDGWVDRGENSNVELHAAVQARQTEDLTWTISTDYGDRSPMRYFGTPLVNGHLLEALRFNNYNVRDSNIRYQDSWNQLKTEWQVTDSISVHNTLYYLGSQRHWRDLENDAYNPTTGVVDRTNSIEIFHDQRQIGDRMDATLRGHIFGMANEFVTGFDVNNISFTHTNNSPYKGPAQPVSLYNFDPGVFSSTYPTVPSFSTTTNQYAVFAEDRFSITEQLSLIGGIRQDEPTVERTDYISSISGSFEKAYHATSWRAGAVYEPIKNLAFYGQYSVAVDPVSNLITMSGVNRDFQLSTGKEIEVGVKQSFWGGRGEWTLAAYQIVKNNLLARDPINPMNTNPVQIGQQSSRGIEASVGFALDHGWRIDASTALLRANYDDFIQVVGGIAVNFAGNLPVNVPQTVSNIWATWAFAPSWSANAGILIVGKTYADAANTVAMPAYSVVNAGVQWKPDLCTTVSFRVYNVFDTVYATSGTTSQWLLGMPRTAQLAINVKF
jgi:iron complex outermembrane recepter protein